jgi:hypothetical protein
MMVFTMKHFLKLLLIFCVSSGLLLLTACDIPTNDKLSVDTVIKYCEEKYSDKFTFVSMGNELWTSDYSDVVLSSEALNDANVNVRVYSADRILDNYIAVKYKISVEEKVTQLAQNIYGDVLVVNVPIAYGVDSFSDSMTFEDYIRADESEVFVAIATNDSRALKDEKIEKLRTAFEEEEICAAVKLFYFDTETIEELRLSEETGKVFEQTPVMHGLMTMNSDFSVQSLSWTQHDN